MTILMWILTALVGLFFLFAGTMKTFGIPEQMFKMQKETFFDNYGIDRNGIRAIGLVELFGGVTVWFWTIMNPLALVGLAVLLCTTAGAMYYHWRYDSLFKMGAPAIVMFVLSGILLLLNVL